LYTVLTFFFVFAISMSFLCSLWEAVLLSITPAYTQIQLNKNNYLGKQLQKFKNQIDIPLAAILTLNTIAHTVGAIGVGEQASVIWGNTDPYITKLLVPVVMTLSILLLSEIIPKTIGANHWKNFIPFTVYSLSFLIKALYPLVWLCKLVTKLFPGNHGKSIFSRSDFLALTEIGEVQGVFEESEADLIERSLDLHELRVREAMRPANEMVFLNKEEPLEDLLNFMRTHKYTRYPVLDSHRNEIIGVVHIKDLLSRQNITQLDEIIRPVLKVQAHLPLKNLLNRFRAGMPHFALVYKNKNLFGFITLDNILHILLGNMKDEFHRTDVDWAVNEEGIIQAKGRCSIYALEQLLDRDVEVKEGIETLAGLIYETLERVPKEGDKVEFSNFTAIIEKMNKAQIQSVIVNPIEKDETT